MRSQVEGYLDLAYAIVVMALKDAVGVGRADGELFRYDRPQDGKRELAHDAIRFLGSRRGAFLCESLNLNRNVILAGLSRCRTDADYRDQLANRMRRVSLSRATALGFGTALLRKAAAE